LNELTLPIGGAPCLCAIRLSVPTSARIASR